MTFFNWQLNNYYKKKKIFLGAYILGFWNSENIFYYILLG
jgi:hypothetical protein